MADALFCAAHQVPATEFCLCGPNPVYLCVTCIPTHSDKRSHDVFPIASLELYSALGNDKAELKRRSEVVEKSLEFLNNSIGRVTAAFIEATALEVEIVKNYQTWLANNHRCFDFLMEVLRRDNAAGSSAPPLSPLSQVLADRTKSFKESDARIFSSVPEKDSLELLNQQFKEALASMPSIEQWKYNAEVRRAFLNQTLMDSQPSAQGDVKKIIEVDKDHINLFDVTICQWQPTIRLHKNIGLTNPPSTFISLNQIFVCGAGGSDKPCTCNVADVAYVLGDDGTVQELEHMLTARSGHGLIWDPARKAVYVFGGRDHEGN